MAFRELYTGRRRKDPKAWMDYFTSGDFLDVAWERRFAGLLLEEVTRLEGEYPIPREFLTWLCAVYQFAVDRSVYWDWDSENERTEFSFRIDQDAQFEGQEFLFQLAARGPAIKPFKGAERAISWSFADYRALLRLAEKGRWTEGKLKKAGKILDGYMLGNFEDRNPTPSERHPAGMRLINHFFQREKLPKELYQMAWQKLELKTALMGRAKLYPWRFHCYCRSNRSIYVCRSASGISSTDMACSTDTPMFFTKFLMETRIPLAMPSARPSARPFSITPLLRLHMTDTSLSIVCVICDLYHCQFG